MYTEIDIFQNHKHSLSTIISTSVLECFTCLNVSLTNSVYLLSRFHFWCSPGSYWCNPECSNATLSQLEILHRSKSRVPNYLKPHLQSRKSWVKPNEQEIKTLNPRTHLWIHTEWILDIHNQVVNFFSSVSINK